METHKHSLTMTVAETGYWYWCGCVCRFCCLHAWCSLQTTRVFNRNIEELQEKNQQLLESLRDLSKRHEEEEAQATDARWVLLSVAWGVLEEHNVDQTCQLSSRCGLDLVGISWVVCQMQVRSGGYQLIDASSILRVSVVWQMWIRSGKYQWFGRCKLNAVTISCLADAS